MRDPASGGVAANVGECDALATDRAGVALAIQTADCVPILLAVAAGGRRRARRLARLGAERRRLGGRGPARASAPRPQRSRAWLGPSIGPCCYEVGGEVAAQFAGDFVRAGCGGGYRLDLRAVNVAQLEAAGVPRAAIAVHPSCTKCGGEVYASYRRDGAKAGRMIALIART